MAILVKYRSKKQAELYKQRRPLVEEMLREQPGCQACIIRAAYLKQATVNQRPATDVHELKRRSQGGSILDRKNLITICRPCHNWVTTHPHEAEMLGLHLPGWAKDDMWDEAKRVRNSWLDGICTEPYWHVDEGPYR